MKWRCLLSVLLVFAMMGSACAWADTLPIAPEVVSGRIMAYVINDEGAEVFGDIYEQGASLEPVETIPYGTEIEIRILGLGYCRLRRDTNEVLYVRTRDLSFSEEPFEDQLAVVFVKRSNKLPLHRTASAKSKTLTTVPDGTYVVVLEKGDTFSRVLYGKYDGYLQNAYLSYRVAWQEDPQQAILRDPNNAKRIATVSLRSADSLNGKKVTTLPTFKKGTKNPYVVQVLQFKGEWAEIETEKGVHGYLKAEWVELTEPQPVEPEEEKAEEIPEAPEDKDEDTADEQAAPAETETETEPPAGDTGTAEAAGEDTEAASEADAGEDPEADAGEDEVLADDEEEPVAMDDEEESEDEEGTFDDEGLGPEGEEE